MTEELKKLRKMLLELDDQLVACMRCGMCQAVCPIYAETGLEGHVARGKIALLEAIAKTGSITAAAKSLDMSYRRAWLLLDELNRSLRVAAVDSAKGGPHGGGSALTDAGRQLIELYRRIEANAAVACRDDIGKMMGMVAR